MKEMKYASQFGDEYLLVTDSQEVKFIKEYFGIDNREDLNSFFVIAQEGDFGEVWGSEWHHNIMNGIFFERIA